MPIPITEDLRARVNAITGLAELLSKAGTADVYLVGGALRDMLRDRAPIDIDLAVEGDPAGLLATTGTATSQTAFGTFSVVCGTVRFDIARTRRERYPHPGALPEVQAATIQEDLLRRDFTVNAIALGLAGSRTGELIAPAGALADLQAGRLRVQHDASFTDDPTRLLRLARYAGRLGFSVHSHTQSLMRHALDADALSTISGARLGNELRHLAREEDPVSAFEACARLGLSWSIDRGLAQRALAVLPPDGRSDLLVLAMVLPAPDSDTNTEGKQLPHLLDSLAFTAAERDRIVQVTALAPSLARRLQAVRSSAEIARAVGDAAVETVALACALGPAAAARRWLDDLRHRKLAITGTDLLAAGIPEGPAIGRALDAAKHAMFDGLATDRASQLAAALRAAR
ncbi:MAG: CCA tRNA nucleotidyltransferase [Solirubrobacteraceae bacterium]